MFPHILYGPVQHGSLEDFFQVSREIQPVFCRKPGQKVLHLLLFFPRILREDILKGQLPVFFFRQVVEACADEPDGPLMDLGQES